MSDLVHMPYAKWHFHDWRTHTEGLSNDEYAIYHRLCMAMYQFGGPLPDDDDAMRHRLAQTRQKYRKVKAVLIARKFITIENGHIFQKRVIEELNAYATAVENRKKAQKNRKKSQKSCEKLSESSQVSREKPNENNDPPEPQGGYIEIEKEKEKKKKKDSPPLPPAGGAQPIRSASEMFPDPYADDVGVKFTDGKLILFNGTRQFWLDSFGGSEAELKYALLEVAPKIKPNHPTPVAAQVQTFLAERARGRCERGGRYDARVAQGNTKNKTARERQRDKVQAALTAMREDCSGNA